MGCYKNLTVPIPVDGCHRCSFCCHFCDYHHPPTSAALGEVDDEDLFKFIIKNYKVGRKNRHHPTSECGWLVGSLFGAIKLPIICVAGGGVSGVSQWAAAVP